MSLHNRRHSRSQEKSISSLDEDTEKGSLDSPRKQHMSHRSSFLVPAPSPISPIHTPVYSAFATPYVPPSRRTSAVPTPTASHFSNHYFTPPNRPTSGPLPAISSGGLPNPYMMPPLPHHWNTQPASPIHTRHFSTGHGLPESIPEESSVSDTDSEGGGRNSARLSKPSRTSRLPYLS